MVTALTTFIDKRDGFELVRDQIASILVENVAAQKKLAATAGKDPVLSDLLVFTESSAPWEIYLNNPPPTPAPPIVNVWYSSGSFEPARSDVVRRQLHAGIFMIDVFGFSSGTVDRDEPTKQLPADREASFAAHRGVRLARNILMAAPYTYLDLRGFVWGARWLDSIQVFQPELTDDSSLRALGMRLSLNVSFNETAPQGDESVLLDEVQVDIHRTGDGKIIAEADFVGLEIP